ncbi:TIGR02680 family protein [Brachybacterium vulturis]|uniref:TIGR02680 family protein n=1 Tax=Brachybacterium vulturis TaxID=2017484 RepID=A0A291GMG9_9MICO|nr:TIGR02680 family protein [Brachybacterium vulturis]ATG51357.1 TIGR02680 family protein [Brachybacterium vulturis]
MTDTDQPPVPQPDVPKPDVPKPDVPKPDVPQSPVPQSPMQEPAPAGAPPRPTSERWQPLRLGLIDLFYYDDEQFWFHDGRLLLRGNNGTGKSKVLALTLPFLLDGSTAPRRVEPDADPKKRMDWNLLLGGAHPHSERTGYSWAEFGRVDADGTEHFTTLGIGLKAAAGRGVVKTWWFTSTRRIGDLRLLDESRIVLTQERLRDELASTSAGQVHTTQAAYRRAVDEALFRLGEERYGALIDLLIQLRQPQLSKKPDEKALSAALTEALAPLDQAVVADVAESFRSLEDERDGIAAAKDTLGAAEAFLGHYRDYAKVASRRHTTTVRLANSAYEQAGRDLREAEEQLSRATTEVEHLARRQLDAEERRSTLQGQEQALQASPEMREADRLDEADRDAREAERNAAQAGEEAQQAAATARRETEEAAAAARHVEASRADADRHEVAAGRQAGPAGLQPEHADIAGDEETARRALARRRERIRHVRGLIEAAQRARTIADHQRTVLDTAQSEEAERAETLRAVHERVETAVAAYGEAVQAHLGGLELMELDRGIDELSELSHHWARSVVGTPPVSAALDAAAATARDRIGRERAAAAHAAGRLSEELDAVRTRIAELEAGRAPEPPSASSRDAHRRDDRHGAPLWWLADFADAVPEGDRAGVEAALQSAGLLDAWVFPDGTMAADGDVVLGPAGPESTPSLAEVLVPATGPEESVGAEAVRAVLSRIGWGEVSGAGWWIDGQGRWGAGPARGSWTKDRAEYLGASAREAHRRELLGELRGRAAELETECTALADRVAAADEQTRQVERERAGYPAARERELSSVHDRAVAAQQEADLAQAKVDAALTVWERAADAADWEARELDEQAWELGVGTTTAQTDDALAAVSAYEVTLVEVRRAARAVVDAATAQERADRRAAEATALQERREVTHRDLRTRAAAGRARYQALHETVGASVAELQARLGEATAALEATAAELKTVGTEQLTAASTQGRLEENVRDLGRRRGEMAAEREGTIEALRAFAETGLLRVALPDLALPAAEDPEGWSLTAGLGLARSAEQHLHEIAETDEAWASVQQRVSGATTELSQQMSRHGHTAFTEQRGDVLLVRVRWVHEEVDIDHLVERLDQDVTDRERLLSAREREILENHLVNEVAGHLHELLLTAEGQIDRMNRELAERRTSTGMQLRVRWREHGDAPAGLAAARRLMLRSDATWTPEDRTAIGEFLQARIAEIRQSDPTGAWQEHLEQALDYRKWHTFVVERRQNGHWRSASGPASGGERALAVSVPLFAAASAHYNSASDHAPRLILLDEAFAGIDDDSRAKSLGLLATFDLDVVMTSEREWGCYPEVPGLSIAQLSRIEGIDAVGVTRWRWDGRRRHRQSEVADSARAGARTPPTSDGETLFG